MHACEPADYCAMHSAHCTSKHSAEVVVLAPGAAAAERPPYYK